MTATSADPEHQRIARHVIDSNKYMTLATVDEQGTPWATPVYFTPDGYDDFFWVSSPDARHSRNVAQRPDVSIVIFDSTVPIGGAQAVYMAARAALVPEDEIERCAELYAARYPELRFFPPEELRAPALFRLYRARVSEHSVLIGGSDPEYGTGVDTRMVVRLT